MNCTTVSGTEPTDRLLQVREGRSQVAEQAADFRLNGLAAQAL
jgi:hypothetical protein